MTAPILSPTLAALTVAQQPRPVAVRPWLITEPLQTDTGAARVTTDYLRGEADASPDSDAIWRLIAAGEDGLGRRIARVRTANLLEDAAAALPVAGDGRSVTVALRPFEILTLLVEESR